MANPFAPFPDMSPDNGIVTLSISFVVGAVGAVGAVSGGREMGTPVRNGVGDYTFPLREGWILCEQAVAQAVGPHSTTAGKYAEPIADNSTALSSPHVRFQFTRGSDGAAAEVATGDVVTCTLRLKRYSA
jgi:hypothetical protein